MGVVKKRYIVDYEKQLNWLVSKIRSSDEIVPSDKKMLHKYYQFLVIKGISTIRVYRYLLSMFVFAKQQPYTGNITRDKIINFLYCLRTKNYAGETIKFYIYALKYYLKMTGKEKYLYLLDIKTEKNIRNDYLDFDTVLNIIKLIDNEDYKAYTMFLYDTGARPSEAMSVMLKHINIYKDRIIFRVNGKTGERGVVSVIFKDYLEKYINKKKAQGSEYLFDISYNYYVRKVLKKIQKTLGLPALYPYIFRHSRATDLANVLTESQLKKFFGWSEDSKALKRYIKRDKIDIPTSKLQVFAKKCVGVQS